MTDCPDDWREQIFAPHHPVIPWLHIKDFKLVSLKMIVSSMLVHQRRKVKKGPQLQSPGQDTPDNPAADSDEARVSDTGKRGFALARNRLRLTTALSDMQPSSGASLSDTHGDGVWIDGIFVPKTQLADETTSPEGSFKSSRSSRRPSTSSPRESERVPSLLTLGADLYVAGEVTQQQLGFPTSTTLIVSVDNPGAEALVKVSPRASEPIPLLGSNAT